MSRLAPTLRWIGTVILFAEIGGLAALGAALFDRSWLTEGRGLWRQWLWENELGG